MERKRVEFVVSFEFLSLDDYPLEEILRRELETEAYWIARSYSLLITDYKVRRVVDGSR